MKIVKQKKTKTLKKKGHHGEDLQDYLGEIIPGEAHPNISTVEHNLQKLAKRFGDEVYSAFLRQTFHVILEPKYAKDHWQRMVQHHKSLKEKTGENFDFRVSSLDYLMREAELIINPIVLETEEFRGVHQDTITDALTGLYNYRYFQKVLGREVSRSKRYSTQLSILFFDIDHFKRLNDLFGHINGDKVLLRVSEVIAGCVRSIDLPCRYGGEEFVIIAPQTSREGAFLLAERIRTSVALQIFPELRSFSTGVTISGGIATFPKDADNGQTLLDRADQALYMAKSNGRNRIEYYRSDQRRQLRFPVKFPVAVSIPRKGRRVVPAKNASEDGLLLQVSEPIAIGSVINIEVDLEEKGKSVKCVGTVTHLEKHSRPGSYDMGISIVRISQTDHKRYCEFLADRVAA